MKALEFMRAVRNRLPLIPLYSLHLREQNELLVVGICVLAEQQHYSYYLENDDLNRPADDVAAEIAAMHAEQRVDSTVVHGPGYRVK